MLEYLDFLFVFCCIVVYVCTHACAGACVQPCVHVCEDQRLIAGVFLNHPPPSFLRQDPPDSPAVGLQTNYVPSLLCRSGGRLILMLTCILLTKPPTHTPFFVLFLTQDLLWLTLTLNPSPGLLLFLSVKGTGTGPQV